MARPASSPARRSATHTALDLLKADHAAVSKLFKQFAGFKKSLDRDRMQQVAQEACKALAIHARIEEEIFYPAVRDAADADAALDEADVEHSHIKELVAQLEGAGPVDGQFEARVKVLSEYVRHHVDEEEKTIFSKARNAGLDLVALGQDLQARKEELGADDEAIAVAMR
jgi:hemerythrin superfamily protein